MWAIMKGEQQYGLKPLVKDTAATNIYATFTLHKVYVPGIVNNKQTVNHI